ncbi:RNA 2',3'-cyclic phosphodiesterase [Pseudomonas sp. NPDC089752]|uniref:RNA 2',3'-cyclic phosphodiesterase n=1 Tax=Pseudomonas sp. NPDC089752 TaxID=3364472 RepID=UPI003813D460
MVQDIRPSGAPFKRLFFALPVGDAQRRAIAQWRRGLELRSGKPVPSENFHLTLLFLGDVDTAQVPAICAAVDNLLRPEAPLRLLLDQLKVWPRASALVLEPQETPATLRQLVYGLQQVMLPMGVAEQAREYRPHLTLSRNFRGQVPEASVVPDFFITARHFTLYESRKGQYWPLAQWPLTG